MNSVSPTAAHRTATAKTGSLEHSGATVLPSEELDFCNALFNPQTTWEHLPDLEDVGFQNGRPAASRLRRGQLSVIHKPDQERQKEYKKSCSFWWRTTKKSRKATAVRLEQVGDGTVHTSEELDFCNALVNPQTSWEHLPDLEGVEEELDFCNVLVNPQTSWDHLPDLEGVEEEPDFCNALTNPQTSWEHLPDLEDVGFQNDRSPTLLRGGKMSVLLKPHH